MGTGERPSTSENNTLTDGWLSPPPPETSQTATTPDLGTKEDQQAPTTVPNSGAAATNAAIARVIVTDETPEQATKPQQPVQPQAPAQSLLVDPSAQHPPTGKGDTLRMKPEIKYALAAGVPPVPSDSSNPSGPRGTVRNLSPWLKPDATTAQPKAPQPSNPAQKKPLAGDPTVRKIIPRAGWRPSETTPNEKPASDEIPKNPILRTRTTIAVAAIAALAALYIGQKAFKTPSKPDISATTPSVKVPNAIDAGTDSGTTSQATPSASASQAPINSANVAPSKTAAPSTSATANPKTKPPRAQTQRGPKPPKGDDSNNYHNGEIVTPKTWGEEPGL